VIKPKGRKPGSTKHNVQRVVARHMAGETRAEIAESLNISTRTVSRYLRIRRQQA